MISIDDLLLAETSPALREIYRALPMEARSFKAGLLAEEIIILDTETTGLSFKDCELIEVAAKRLNGPKEAENFSELIKPTKPIPPDIEALTGITNKDVSQARSAQEVVEDLADFVGGRPIIAHNAAFDRGFIERVSAGKDISEHWIDSLTLSRIALPMLKNHRLSDMAEAFGCAAVSHRALDDVNALSELWSIILCALTKLPAGLLNLFADMHPEYEWEYRPIFSHLAGFHPQAQFSLECARENLLKEEAGTTHFDPNELEIVRVPTAQEIEEAFSGMGLVAKMYPAYEQRPEQLALAEQVRRALSSSTHRAIEAGTGVGKSVGYLLPLTKFAQENKITCGVATKTNALTDQIITQELPALAAQLPAGIDFKSLKGYEHYPCIRKLNHALDANLPLELAIDKRRSDEEIAADMLSALATTLAFAAQSPTGDLDSLGIRWRSVPQGMLASTADECQHMRCPYFSSTCMLHGARRRAAQADIVVTNHSLVLANVASGGQILPPIRHWVIDEAHSFEQEARRQWATEVSASNTRAVFESLGGLRSGALHQLISAAAGTEAQTLSVGLLTKTAGSASRAMLACSEMFEEIRDLTRSLERGSVYDTALIWLSDEVRSTPEWARVSEAATTAAERLKEVSDFLEQALDSLGKEKPNTLSDATELLHRIQEIYRSILLIITGSDKNYVFSCEASKSRPGQERLLAELLDVGAALSERWYPECHSVTYTSATMAVGDDFSHFEHGVGLDRLRSGSHKSIRLDSSFDFDANMKVLVVQDLPAPGTPEYVDELNELLVDIHTSLSGSVLSLFTNKREMERVFDTIQPKLSQQGLELLCQGQGSSARQLRERFVADEKISLLALKSFWEGFDAAGDTLKCVVIPRLPFSSPTEPLSCERALREPRAWWRYSLPEAILEVKQAAGRLIRTATDSGYLVLADSRLIEKRYGRQFIDALPSKNVSVVSRSEITSYLR